MCLSCSVGTPQMNMRLSSLTDVQTCAVRGMDLDTLHECKHSLEETFVCVVRTGKWSGGRCKAFPQRLKDGEGGRRTRVRRMDRCCSHLPSIRDVRMLSLLFVAAAHEYWVVPQWQLRAVPRRLAVLVSGPLGGPYHSRQCAAFRDHVAGATVPARRTGNHSQTPTTMAPPIEVNASLRRQGVL